MAAPGGVQFWWQQWDNDGILFSSLFKWQLKVGYNIGGSGGIVVGLVSGSSRWVQILVAALG